MGIPLSLSVSNMKVVFELWFLYKWYDKIPLLFSSVSLHFCKIVPNVHITNFDSFRRSFYLGELIGMIISICKGRACILALPVSICSRSDFYHRELKSHTSVKKYLETLFLFDSGKCLSIHHKAAVTIDSTCTCLGSQISQFARMIRLPSFMRFHLK